MQISERPCRQVNLITFNDGGRGCRQSRFHNAPGSRFSNFNPSRRSGSGGDPVRKGDLVGTSCNLVPCGVPYNEQRNETSIIIGSYRRILLSDTDSNTHKCMIRQEGASRRRTERHWYMSTKNLQFCSFFYVIVHVFARMNKLNWLAYEYLNTL